MTLDMLYTLIAEDIAARRKGMRQGLAAFLSLNNHAPGIAALIRESSSDPFFTDDHMDAFFDRIRQIFPGDLRLHDPHGVGCGANW